MFIRQRPTLPLSVAAGPRGGECPWACGRPKELKTRGFSTERLARFSALKIPMSPRMATRHGEGERHAGTPHYRAACSREPRDSVVGYFDFARSGKSCDTGGMPKRKSTKRPTDVNQLAHQLVQESTEPDEELAPSKADISRVMAEMGRRGGKIGGKRRAARLTPKQRSESASRAARARWGKE